MGGAKRLGSQAAAALLGLMTLPAPWAQEAATVPDAAAQDAPVQGETLATIPVQTTPAAEPENVNRLEEVVVTARKRSELLQDVPVAVSSFSAAQLEARGIQNIRDLSLAIPGFQVSDLGGYNMMSLRGIGTDIFIPSAEPSVATYLDGVYFPSGHSLGQAFGAVERVEVLKGPQGTLFGRNATGGAVSIWTKQPGREFETSVESSYASFNDSRTRAYVNLPFGEVFAASVSGYYHHRDSYYTLDNGTDHTLPAEVNRGARLKLGFNFSDDVDLVLTGLVAQQSGTSTTVSANVEPSNAFGATLQPETRDYVATANSEPSLTFDTRAYYGILNWRNPGIDTKLLGSHAYVNAHDYNYDFDGTDQPIASYGALSEFQRTSTAELQFTSNEDSWGASRLKWVGGLYYLQSTGGYDPGYLRLLDTVVNPLPGLIAALPGPLQSAVDQLLGGAIVPESLTFYFFGTAETKSYSAYLQSTASLTDWLNLTVGGRWQRETRALARSDVGLGTLDGGIGTAYSFSPEESKTSNFSPKLSLDLRPARDLLLYASYQGGYKSGTYNVINIFAQPSFVQPEEVTAYELGLKSEWFNNSLRFNAAVFQNDIRNQQTGFMSFTSGGAVNLENAGKARIRGVEVDLAWRPLPRLNPGLKLGGSASWLDAKYRDYENGRGFNQQGIAYQSDCRDNSGNYDASLSSCHDFSGNQIVRVPDFTATATLSQSFKVPGGSLEVAGDYYYNSGFYYLAQNTPTEEQSKPDSYEPAYALVNARVSYLLRRAGLRLTVFGENLTDERYNAGVFMTDFGRQESLAPPRIWGARLNLDF